MAGSNQQKNQHLLWRIGFGPEVEDIAELSSSSPDSWYKKIMGASLVAPDYIDVADNMFTSMMAQSPGQALQKKDLSPEEKKMFRKQSQQDIKHLNLAWLNIMVKSKAQLREKMSLFWHGHFASRNVNIFYQQILLQIIRKNALGNFGDLLHEVSKSAAMLNFLNNNQNKKDHPNENFAREVMELFTMGRGNYSEQDVKNAARAFTGWGANFQGEFVFRKFQHDTTDKTILGRTGNFDGDDVLNILLQQWQTAYFIVRKIYTYFVNDIADHEKVEWLADRFYKSNYNISQLMEDIFTSHWFYDDKNIGARIKSPVELLVGIRRMLPMQIENEDSLILLQRVLGQLLFFPPNVAGWPGGTNWIDSSALMLRMRIPQLICEESTLQVKPKDDDDQMMGMKEAATMEPKLKGAGKMNPQAVHAQVDWNTYIAKSNRVPREKLIGFLSGLLLQTGTAFNDTALLKYTDATTRESFVKTATVGLMSTPEFQLC